MALTERDAQRNANNFTHHRTRIDQRDRLDPLRDRFRFLADDICEKCMESRERSTALTKLEEAFMWAEEAIARNE